MLGSLPDPSALITCARTRDLPRHGTTQHGAALRLPARRLLAKDSASIHREPNSRVAALRLPMQLHFRPHPLTTDAQQALLLTAPAPALAEMPLAPLSTRMHPSRVPDAACACSRLTMQPHLQSLRSITGSRAAPQASPDPRPIHKPRTHLLGRLYMRCAHGQQDTIMAREGSAVQCHHTVAVPRTYAQPLVETLHEGNRNPQGPCASTRGAAGCVVQRQRCRNAGDKALLICISPAEPHAIEVRLAGCWSSAAPRKTKVRPPTK